jgi:hypothetical protein
MEMSLNSLGLRASAVQKKIFRLASSPYRGRIQGEERGKEGREGEDRRKEGGERN